MRALPTLRTFFAVLLLVAGGAKLLDIDGFYSIVEDYQLLPWALIIPGAWLLVVAEIGIALWLAGGRALAHAAAAVVVLHGVYLAWIAVAAARGIEIENCGCFGVFWPRPLSAWTFVEDAVLLMLATWLAIMARRASPRTAAAAFH